MKTFAKISAITALFLAACVPSSIAQIVIPSDGSDGALVITNNTVIDLSQAVTGSWNANNSANAGLGIYDPTQWAVVFKYSSINIASNATVTFFNHPSTAPVVWLVSGDVEIDGAVNLDGQDQNNNPLLAEPGPGGFRGGSGNIGGGAGPGAGFGPGACNVYYNNNFGWYGPGNYGQPLGFNNFGNAWNGGSGSPPYGNPSLIPLLGGSGGYGSDNSTGGGAGGGAILIACSGSLTVDGTIQANGGYGANGGGGSSYGGGLFPGSGGGIRVVASTVSGNGTLTCDGGFGYFNNGYAGFGRIRIERVTDTSNLQIVPDPSLLPLTNGVAPNIFMPPTGPSVAIETIGGLPTPADPRASFGGLGADVTLPPLTTTAVTVLTTNVEPQSVVTVRVTPRSSGGLIDTVASVTQTLSSSPLIIRWTANVPMYSGYQAMIVHVVRP